MPPTSDSAAQREMQRLQALLSYDVLDTDSEEVFDEFARLAASVAGVPIALVSLVDGYRQWFKAKVGITASETPRDVAFCSHAIQGEGVFIVPDAAQDARFSSNPLVTGNPNIRFYAGAPLMTAEGHALGTLCVIDTVPRILTQDQQQALLILGRHVMAQLELRRQLKEFTRTAAERIRKVTPLRHALDANEFVLHYQPKVSLRSGRIVGVEALIRWNSPERGLIYPGDFIPTLEESGLITEVGVWVVQQAQSDYLSWLEQDLPAPRIAVNVSPVQVRSRGFVSQIQAILQPCPHCGIDLEITEGLLLEQTEESIGKLSAVRQMGPHIAIDDFGTGYSSLRYLAQLPIDCLKIDRSFVHAMTTSPSQSAIVSSVIGLAHGLGMTVIAEGVETEEQRRALRMMRCDQMQGYYHSRPMPNEQLVELLSQQSAAQATTEVREQHPDTAASGRFFMERRRTRSSTPGADG